MSTSGPGTPPPDDVPQPPADAVGTAGVSSEPSASDLRPGDRIRASHADREAVINRLNTAFSEGRLDVSELDDRVGAAYAAKTLGDLRPLTRDLPAESRPAAIRPSPAATNKSPVAAASDWVKWARYGLPSAVVISFVIWAAISVASAHWVYPWWIWIVVAWVCGAFGSRRSRH
ncbi:MAG: DUF1707 SHOCT-like domain-containing protein [Mycobacteriales bacterium]